MKFIEEKDGYAYYDDENNLVGKITLESSQDPDVLLGTRVYTHPDYRGQGIAGKLLNETISKVVEQGKKIKAVCPYMVNKFKADPEKYRQVDADAE